MPQIHANGVRIEYEIEGPARGAPMLLIMGLGGQLTAWSPTLKEGLVARGFRLISYDHRDCGLSQRMSGSGLPDFDAIEVALADGRRPQIAYGLDDMAADAVGLLDALGVPAAHVLGASMGGMVGQILAADFPDRVLSLTAMMTPGDVAKPDPVGMATMSAPLAPEVTLDTLAEVVAAFLAPKMSPAWPTPIEELKASLLAGYRRSYYPEGFVRQTAAAYAGANRSAKLRAIQAPTLVLHGEEDQLAPVAGAREAATLIPGATLHVIPGWGHDMPPQLTPVFVEKIAANAARAGGPR